MTNENNMTTAPVATFPEYLETTIAEGNLNSFDCCLDWSEDLHGGVSDWLKGRYIAYEGGADAAASTLDDLREVAENLDGAVSDARQFIANYFEQSGAIAEIRAAIVAFDKLPTDANRKRLVDVSEPLMGHVVKMDAPTKAIIRKYASNRFWRSNIHFGTVHSIAERHYNHSLIFSEAA